VTEHFDVVVVGGGGAGLAAAISAAESGARVVLLEKGASLGGSTAWSVGSVSVNRSPHQRRAGIDDSPDAHFDDMELLAGPLADRDNRVLRRMLVDNIAETFDWLLEMGLVFVGPHPEPPHRVARMHNILPSSRAFPERLERRARVLGVSMRLGVCATELVIESGSVTGVKVCDESGREHIVASNATVLAGGDYSAGAALLAEFAGAKAADLVPVNPGATGAGLELGRNAGGAVVNGDLIHGPVLRFVPPPQQGWWHALPTHPAVSHLMRLAYEWLPRAVARPFLMRFLTTALGVSGTVLNSGAILINREGQRFCNEIEDASNATAEQTASECYLLFDQAVADQLAAWPNFVSTAPGVAYAYLDDYRRTRPDIFFRASNIKSLAQAAHLPEAVSETVARYNDDERGTDRPALNRGPFYVLGPMKAYLPFTEGGLAVDASLRVLSAGDEPILGLYAAGSNGQGGVLLEGHGHHLGWAFVSGRIAGGNAAAFRGPR
jgi:succinate dehydrogenase/fumarate reductase flavoprotein subunit